MPSPNSASPTGDFFNDLSRSGNENGSRERSNSPKNRHAHGTMGEDADRFVPRTKRIACIVCRKRKLKCDGTRPSCGTCARLGHSCAYDEARKKSGPKRGYVKHLEARLAQVETLLKTHDPSDPTEPSNSMLSMPSANFSDVPSISTLPGESAGGIPHSVSSPGVIDPHMDSMMDNLGLAADEAFSWELISLGLEEPLPSQEVINDMHQIYFDKIHTSTPMIHRPRYLASMDLAPNMRPPICLRYAIWTHVCSVTPKYAALSDHFYARARKYAEQDEIRGFGESMITVTHCQCWSLIATYEFKMMYFPRAWMSVGRATRLAQMSSLHRQDGPALDVKQALPPPRDWIEGEERRRTFWLAFCQDRYASIGTGWPMTIDERDISTNLPATEEAFLSGVPEKTLPLAGVMTPDGASTLSPFGGVVLMACLFGRNLTHLHRPDSEDNDHDLNGEFWKRHRSLDNILLNTSLSLPHQLRLPAGINDSNIVFVNMNIHASTICLHQAAIFKADKNLMSPQISSESKRRCIIAADQIANIMRLISHIDLSTMNPFIAFCLYVAARVFVQYLKVHRDDAAVTSSLQFLLAAMQALKGKNPLTESFLVQLDIDIESSGLRLPVTNTGQSSQPLQASSSKPIFIPVEGDHGNCASLFNIRAAQGEAQATTAHSDRPTILKATSRNSTNFLRMPNGPNRPCMGVIPDRSKDSPRPAASDSLYGGVSSRYEQSNSLLDMDISFENLSNPPRFPSQQNSGQPTPSTSPNHDSSQTSFSPSYPEDHPNLTNTSSMAAGSPSTASTAPAYSNQQAFPFYDPSLSHIAKVPGSDGVPNPFSMPTTTWTPGNDGLSSGNMIEGFELAGMAAGDISSWQPLNVVEGHGGGLFTDWNGADTSM